MVCEIKYKYLKTLIFQFRYDEFLSAYTLLPLPKILGSVTVVTCDINHVSSTLFYKLQV